MNTKPTSALAREPEEAGDDSLTLEAGASLSALRLDAAPPRDLWSGIEARINVAANLPIATDERRPAVLAVLRSEAVPQRDLWPDIESRIHLQRWRRLRVPLSAAAGLAATLVVLLGLQVHQGSDQLKPVDHAPLRASAAVIAAMQDADGELSDRALRRTSIHPLAPETRALVRANLKIVANAETQLKRAIATDPDAAYLQNLLETARQQKQDLRYALAER